jgi:predicted transposase YdaD
VDNFTGGCRFSLVVQSIAEGREGGKKGGEEGRKKEKGRERRKEDLP